MVRLLGILQLDTETNASSSPGVWAERGTAVEQGHSEPLNRRVWSRAEWACSCPGNSLGLLCVPSAECSWLQSSGVSLECWLTPGDYSFSSPRGPLGPCVFFTGPSSLPCMWELCSFCIALLTCCAV